MNGEMMMISFFFFFCLNNPNLYSSSDLETIISFQEELPPFIMCLGGRFGGNHITRKEGFDYSEVPMARIGRVCERRRKASVSTLSVLIQHSLEDACMRAFQAHLHLAAASPDELEEEEELTPESLHTYLPVIPRSIPFLPASYTITLSDSMLCGAIMHATGR